jgi:RND family efflux transporter MFP subunit
LAEEDLSRLKIDKSKVTFRSGKRRKVIYAILAGLLVIILGLLYTQGIFKPAIPVQIATVTQVYPSQTFTVLNASGYVVPQRKSALAAKITGRLVFLAVEEGSHVKKGQIVARLESEDVTAARNQAAANLEAARSNFELARAELRDATLTLDRNKELLSRGVVARATYDTALVRYDKAVAAVEAAEATIRASTAALQGAAISLEYTLIRAPFDAVVLTKNADIGDIVTPIGAAANAKSAVVTIADMKSLQVEADVSESNLGLIRPGQPCEIHLDALPDLRLRGAIHMIVPTADRSKATVMVKVRFVDQDSRVLPEMSAKVAFLSRPVAAEEQKARTALKEAALVNRKGKTAVLLVKEGRVEEREIKTGETMGDMVEILNGAKPGDQVVLNPPNRLRNGSKIKIKEQ